MSYVKFKPDGKWHVVLVLGYTWCGRYLYPWNKSVPESTIASEVIASRKRRPVPIGALCKHCRQAGGK